MPPIRTIPFLLQGHLLATISFPRSPSTIRSTNLPIFFFLRCFNCSLPVFEFIFTRNRNVLSIDFLGISILVYLVSIIYEYIRIIHICNFEFIYLSMKSILSILILTWQIFLDQLFTFVWKYFYTFIS